MRPILALLFYAAAFVFIYAAWAGMPDAWERLGTGFPTDPRAIVCGLLIVNGMAAKLLGHVLLLSTTRAR